LRNSYGSLAMLAAIRLASSRVSSFSRSRVIPCKSPPRALAPDALTVGLINTVLNASARALSEAGNRLDQIASSVFRAKGNQAQRSQIYSNTLDALGRVDEKVSNLRESMVTIERYFCSF
jgi:Mg2+ and Co2+ transporter CorA